MGSSVKQRRKHHFPLKAFQNRSDDSGTHTRHASHGEACSRKSKVLPSTSVSSSSSSSKFRSDTDFCSCCTCCTSPVPTAPLHRCTAASLHRYIAALLHRCTAAAAAAAVPAARSCCTFLLHVPAALRPTFYRSVPDPPSRPEYALRTHFGDRSAETVL